MRRGSVLRSVSRAAVAALAALGMSSANALLIDDDTDDFQIVWAAMVGTNLLSATAFFDVQSVAGGSVVIDVSITNNSVLTTFTNAGLATFGLQTNPEAAPTSSISGASVFKDVDIDNIPSLNFINLCVWAGNNCNGGAQGDLLAVGASDSFQLTIDGIGTSLEVIDSGVKFQTSGGSFEFPGEECPGLLPGCTPPPLIIPEPNPLALLGVSLLAMILVGRLRRA